MRKVIISWVSFSYILEVKDRKSRQYAPDLSMRNIDDTTKN